MPAGTYSGTIIHPIPGDDHSNARLITFAMPILPTAAEIAAAIKNSRTCVE